MYERIYQTNIGALIPLKSYAVVFTCQGIVYDLYSKGDNRYEVRFEREPGFDLEPVVIYPEQHYILATVLDAMMVRVETP
ncbi:MULTISPECIES: hypothetical protein [Pseudoalteromonas]|uniref:hypothetical protein n=1 Tax=Pseudoalteromonas TaxID=53246 RepID=UPI001EFCCEC7|nr:MULTISPECIES: hypothetical protein [Pseudoalteromonas]MCG9761276.1 hypothetical protein [Pseudoalteromonas sp. Isolate6]